jgi:hypothetical protein
MQKIFVNKGETLLEVVMSMGILALVLFSAFGLIGQAVSTHVNVKNRVTAIDIGREGIELFRNIRDTNWIKYSGDKRTQWLCYQDPCTQASHRITTGFYTIDAIEVYGLAVPTEQSMLNLDVSADYNEYRILDSEEDGFTHISGEDTIFYRQLEIAPYSNNACGDNCPEVGVDVISRVQWLEGSRKNQLTLRTRLYDFYDRDDY